MPKFVKGQARPVGAGRHKGSVNKATLATEIFERMGFSPIEAMIEIAQDPKTRKDVKARICADLAQYQCPKLQAHRLIDGDGEDRDIRVIVDYADVSINPPEATSSATPGTQGEAPV